jgi:hypothetical protein
MVKIERSSNQRDMACRSERSEESLPTTSHRLLRMTLYAALLTFALVLPTDVLAQGLQEETAIQVGVPSQAYLGARTTVQAVLADSAGKPIAKEVVYFMVPASFLTGSGDMVVAQAVTNQNGQAVADFENDLEGSLDLRAEFRGDDQYAPSNATAQLSVSGVGQVYIQQAGVQIPGLNQPPSAPSGAALTRPFPQVTQNVPNLWPSMSGWPIALVLLAVWSLYVFVVGLVFRIAAPARSSPRGYNLETGRFE